MRSQRGSITIFSTIAVLLVSAFVFALLEGTRLQELERLANLQTEVAIDATLANYNQALWETYHLLGTDCFEAYEKVYEFSDTGLAKKKTNFLRLKREAAIVDQYTLITDGNGQEFINCVSNYMGEYVLYETAKEIYNQYESIRALLDTTKLDETNIQKAIEMAGTQKKRDVQKANSILETAQQWFEIGFLDLVIEDISALSEAEVSFENGVLDRSLQKGTNPKAEASTLEERIALQQYFCTYMSHFQEKKENRALAYEVEYLLGGQAQDRKNLEFVINKLLLVRGAANLLHLISNPEKSAKAEAIATVVAGASLNPLAIKAVKTGLLTAWSVAESIVDVKALLAGGRVAFIKSEEFWVTDLDALDEIKNGALSAKECSWGLAYEDYLRVFLLLEKEEQLAMRALQIQEITIQRNMADSSFQIDFLLTRASVKARYSYETIFPFLKVMNWKQTILSEAEGGYY